MSHSLPGHVLAFLHAVWKLHREEGDDPEKRAIKIDTRPDGGWPTKFHQKYPDAPKTRGFYNLRTPENPKPGPLTKTEVAMATHIFWKMLEPRTKPTHICGIPNAGTPFGKGLSRLCGIQYLSLKKEGDGSNRQVTGIDGDHMLRNTDEILVIDDVLSEADTKLEVINVLRREAPSVGITLMVLIDREQGGRDTLAKMLPPNRFQAAMTTTQIMDHLARFHLINEQEREAVLSYPTTLIADYKREHSIA